MTEKMEGSNYVLHDNTSRVNEILAKSLAVCTLAPIALLILTWTGIFHFSSLLKGLIIGVGAFATAGPYILYKLKVNDNFLKYYIPVVLALFIGLLGTQNGIGVYITYVMVPIATTLYFDKKFTLKISIYCYLVMVMGVYFNSAGKMEVKYWGWSHWITFRNYIIGFTIEYLVITLFVYQLVKRAQAFMLNQQIIVDTLKEDNERQKGITQFLSRDSIDSRNNVMNMFKNEFNNFTEADLATITSGHRFLATLQNMQANSTDYYELFEKTMSAAGEYFGIDRIIYVEPDFDGEINKLNYQWSRNKLDIITDFYNEMKEDEAQAIIDIYDKCGYIEINEKAIADGKLKSIEQTGLEQYMRSILLGSQLWLPTILQGKYVGAICFDKYDKSGYSAVDILLLSEFTHNLSMNIILKNADEANAAKSAFLSSMSHEIRTPMNAILGMTSVALKEEMSPSLRKDLNVIKSSSEGLLAIINDILDFSKIESGKIDIVNEEYKFLSLMNDIYTIASTRNKEKNLDLSFEISETIPTVLKGDMVRVKQVMVNLVNNAIKYTDEGAVRVFVWENRTDDDKISLNFAVKDTGPGIKEEDIEKLFKSFSQLDKVKNHHKEGTGLGLAISKQLIQLMNGQIGVRSSFGEGSEFFFELPQTIVDKTPCGKLEAFEYDNDALKDNYSFTAPTANILIVDDNEINLMVAEEIFEDYKMNLTTVDSGIAAINYTKTNKYDLIFMDHFMPEMDGLETTDIIRKSEDNLNSNTVIVALTADAVLGAKEKLIDGGMNDFLSKPIEIDELEKLLRKYLPKEKIIEA